nr:MAG TPA: hypothetical protein [Caudoviricetes sp.]
MITRGSFGSLFLSGDKHDTHDLSSWRHEEVERRWIRL